MLAVVAIYLYHLREVSLTSEHVFDSLAVEMEAVSADLESMFLSQALTDGREELIYCFSISLANLIRWNQFCLSINCDEHPSVAELWRTFGLHVTLLLPHE